MAHPGYSSYKGEVIPVYDLGRLAGSSDCNGAQLAILETTGGTPRRSSKRSSRELQRRSKEENVWRYADLVLSRCDIGRHERVAIQATVMRSLSRKSGCQHFAPARRSVTG
ncbi:conserved hypothetical protein [Ricinus communis]|uniref:Uncharacterized protein n=1 Tax=Ricinus communis TaxID=3988 RepID=B9TK69_RICCO|nr:conserved hypothetical protein [Ricinus communis]